MNLNSVAVTDCGSTTTKGIWFQKDSDSNKWKVVAHAEAPTTVEKPVADVTIGVFNSLKALGAEFGVEIVSCKNSESKLILNQNGNEPQMYLSTSSAGGGLQMVVVGLVGNISGKSAERAALGAGAIVQRVVSLDSDLENYEAAQIIRELRPDIILFAGGTDNGAITQVEELAELLLLAEPKSRFETEAKVPIVFAGNKQLGNSVSELLKNAFEVKVVENVRSDVNTENLQPARTAVHDIFLDHVMSQAPGYKKLQGMVSCPIIPTPVAVSKMIEKASSKLDKSILAVDIGGATTDIFSIRKNKEKSAYRPVHRSVSANLGMSYSIGNVIDLAGVENLRRWLPFDMPASRLGNMLWNKMIRPTTLPENLIDLYVEQAAAREALFLSLKHHIELDTDVESLKKSNDMGDIFNAKTDRGFSMFDIDLLIGSGGVLSHAPNRASAGLMLLDSFRPLGITFLGIDSIFMLPHLGVLSETDPDAALELLFSECIVPLGTVVSPLLKSKKVKLGDLLFTASFSNSVDAIEVRFGEIKTVPLKEKEKVTISINPIRKDLVFADLGSLSFEVMGGKIGIIFDGRCGQQDRILKNGDSVELNKEWFKSLEINF